MIPVPRIVAHRGSSGRAPENTIEAMHQAIGEDGAEGLELDLQRSADGEVVVLHDATVDRTTNGRGRADQHDLSSLRALDAGHRFGQGEFRGSGCRIPSLREVLETFPGVWLSLDLKQGDPVTERRTIDLLREFGRERDVVVSAEDPAAARRLARLAPEFPRFLHRNAVREFYFRHRARAFFGWNPPGETLQIPVSHGPFDLTRPRLIRDAHQRGLRVLYWTVNDAELAGTLLQRGADGIITDWPDRIRERVRSAPL
jgi:glycerophosphoryl diester phosphodiesterase